MGDLSLNNIMLSDDEWKVTLIDFEAAESPGNSYNPSIATPGYISNEAKNYMQGDWFALYRIARTLFLPIIPVYDLAPQITHVHDRHIEQKFGKKAINFLREIENTISKYTNLRPQSPFLNQKLSPPTKELSMDNLNHIIGGLQKGLINNLEVDSFSLIKGDIAQFNESINKYNVAYGAFGTILSLIRSGGKNFSVGIKASLEEWFKLIIPYLEKESENLKNNIGLYDGFSGIITVLYELGYENSALSILRNLQKNFTKEEVNTKEDISIYSGLSGIGLLYLSFYEILGDDNLLQSLKLIYDRVITIYQENYDNLEEISNYGLINGWSGAALFLFKSNSLFNNFEGKEIAYNLIDRSIEHASEYDQDEDLHVVDDSRGIDRLIPYIEDGSSGIALTMLEFHNHDKDYLNPIREKVLERFISSNYYYCSANGGLMSGYAGFIPLANAVKHTHNKSDMISILLKGLNNYLVRDHNDEILFPGNYGFKCSMDVSTGAAGVLMVLSDLKKKQWGSWLPIPQKSSIKLFEANVANDLSGAKRALNYV
ncbi:lanthionine synthetase LanC family protein [Ornithinibacillus sp. FSL M8-0202]|uniref:lanthionine synthetase LanC family protein n=1 Tax=unclassified Ornithinibacillus TaxID=2620869 RepID=UPI0030D33420